MIDLRKTSAQNGTTTGKAYSKNDMRAGIVINCKHSKTEFKQAEQLERINYVRQFGMGDKRNWSTNG